MSVTLKSREFSGQPGETLLITGGVHGDEFEPMAAIRRLIHLFETKSAEVAQLRGRVILVPVVNEAAYLRGHRCADDGLDLARTCPGKAEGSITEQTAYALSQLIEHADYYIDMHTGGTDLSVHPMSGYVLHEAPAVLDVQRRMSRAFNLPVVWGTSGKLPGRSLSVARDAGVPAIYTEYLGAATMSPQGVTDCLDGCLNVMAELGFLNRRLAPNRVAHVIEDHAPQSGFMQICNPAPVTGFFEPVVKLGDSVQKGQPLGSVVDVLGGERHVIPADVSGIVLVLRTFPRVRQGESVGVVAG